MARQPVIEDAQMRHALMVAAVTGQKPTRDVVLLAVLYGTGMTATELAQLEVANVLNEEGSYRQRSEAREAISFNGKAQPIYWVKQRVREALDAYFSARVSAGQGTTAWR